MSSQPSRSSAIHSCLGLHDCGSTELTPGQRGCGDPIRVAQEMERGPDQAVTELGLAGYGIHETVVAITEESGRRLRPLREEEEDLMVS